MANREERTEAAVRVEVRRRGLAPEGRAGDEDGKSLLQRYLIIALAVLGLAIGIWGIGCLAAAIGGLALFQGR